MRKHDKLTFIAELLNARQMLAFKTSVIDQTIGAALFDLMNSGISHRRFLRVVKQVESVWAQ